MCVVQGYALKHFFPRTVFSSILLVLPKKTSFRQPWWQPLAILVWFTNFEKTAVLFFWLIPYRYSKCIFYLVRIINQHLPPTCASSVTGKLFHVNHLVAVGCSYFLFNITDWVIMLILFDWPFPGESFWGFCFFKAFAHEFTFVHEKIIISHHWKAPTIIIFLLI